MVSPEFSHFQSSVMAKPKSNRLCFCLPDGVVLLGGAFLALLMVWAFWSFFTTPSDFDPDVAARLKEKGRGSCGGRVNRACDSDTHTFYDDPSMSYSLEKPMKGWDEKRKEWLKLHPTLAAGAEERVILVTGSQRKPCKNPIGDHLLLRAFKNKVDYCRLHGYDIFYNNLFLHPKMMSYWAKLPVVKAAMLAHPEAEWIWWVDSDAIITDMEFKVPLKRYKNHNVVVHGWAREIYKNKSSWTSLNAGVFLIRNCQWSMDLIDVWANMGPISPDYPKWGRIFTSIFKDKTFPESDDQTALIYLLYSQKNKYYDHIYLEGEYYLESYWLEISKKYENSTEKYSTIERGEPRLRRRHAEKVIEQYAAVREEYLDDGGIMKGGWRRPFITHFTGCQPCSGDHNEMYSGQNCWKEMVRALNFADNQVLRNYGFVHSDLQDSSSVFEVPFDYPVDEDGPW